MSVLAPAPSPSHAHNVVQTWDRLWAHPPSEARDRELLERERTLKRWSLIQNRIVETFGRMEGVRTVELGSGRGDLSALLAESGATVSLLDSSERALNQARHRFERMGLAAQFHYGDLFDAGSRTARYDVAISSGVIEHFVGGQRTLAIEAHAESVGRGGLVILSVPNARCWPYRIWKKTLELRGRWPYGYERPFTRGELVRRARDAGLVRAEVRGVGFRQSWRDQFLPLLTGRTSVRRPVEDSPFDERWGLALVLFAWKA
jgi:2-polyprenyl-3-methyl-5-hydroxy-6-metoxy-1,4-benzoquinol methylase